MPRTADDPLLDVFVQDRRAGHEGELGEGRGRRRISLAAREAERGELYRGDREALAARGRQTRRARSQKRLDEPVAGIATAARGTPACAVITWTALRRVGGGARAASRRSARRAGRADRRRRQAEKCTRSKSKPRSLRDDRPPISASSGIDPARRCPPQRSAPGRTTAPVQRPVLPDVPGEAPKAGSRAVVSRARRLGRRRNPTAPPYSGT